MSEITALAYKDISLIRKALSLYGDKADNTNPDKVRSLDLADTLSLVQASCIEEDPPILTITKLDLVDSEILTQKEADNLDEEGLEKLSSRINQESLVELLDHICTILEELGYRKN